MKSMLSRQRTDPVTCVTKFCRMVSGSRTGPATTFCTTGIAGDALKGAGSLTADALGNLTDGIGGLFGIDGKSEGDEKKEEKPKKKR